jgi:hypothetical protein
MVVIVVMVVVVVIVIIFVFVLVLVLVANLDHLGEIQRSKRRSLRYRQGEAAVAAAKDRAAAVKIGLIIARVPLFIRHRSAHAPRTSRTLPVKFNLKIRERFAAYLRSLR